MSKSLGNVISPSDVFETFHPDIIRYYMIKEGGQEGDGNWNNDSIMMRYAFLANNWGNLISRMCSGKFNLGEAVSHVFNRTGEYVGIESYLPEEDERLRNAVESAIDIYRFNMNTLKFQQALMVLDNLYRMVHQHIECSC
jgi:methionyl-tRNA synthetase